MVDNSGIPNGKAAVQDNSLEGLRAAVGSKLFRDFSWTMLWQLAGKLVQVVGVIWAFRKLGPDNIGVSRTVMNLAMTLQFFLAFGLDVVAIRHMARRSKLLTDLVPAIFTFRCLLATGVALLWVAAVWLSPLQGLEKLTWLGGALFLVVYCLEYSWVFQATEQMPRASRFQMIASLGASFWFLVFFRADQPMGSDLAVLLVFNALVSVFVWRRLCQEYRLTCFSLGRMAATWELFYEARPIWLFNLGYYLLAGMALPMTHFLLGDKPSGLYGSAQQLAVSLQVFLQYFGVIMAPRLVSWRHNDVELFRRRVLWLAGGGCVAGLAVAGLLWLVTDGLYPLLYGEAYAGAAKLLPLLMLGKFLAVGSAMFIWAMWAEHRDWLPVVCCMPVCLGVGVLYFWLLPLYGIIGAAWLTLSAEALLLIVSAIVFLLMARTEQNAEPPAPPVL